MIFRIYLYFAFCCFFKFCGRNSVVECQLPKLNVAGSTPVARSKLYFLNFEGKFPSKLNCFQQFLAVHGDRIFCRFQSTNFVD